MAARCRDAQSRKRHLAERALLAPGGPPRLLRPAQVQARVHGSARPARERLPDFGERAGCL